LTRFQHGLLLMLLKRAARTTVFIAAALGLRANAQSTRPSQVTVLKQEQCGTCAVRLTPSGKFGLADDDGALRGLPRLVARDLNGRVLITDQNGGAPQVYDSTGHFLKLLGRVGSGPGEFRHAAAMIPLRDGRLIVFDDALRRVNIFNSDLRFISSNPSPVVTYDAAQWRGDTLIVAANVGTRVSFGLLLHLMRVGVDTTLRSFSFDAVKPFGINRLDRTHVAVVGKLLCAVRERRLAVTCHEGNASPPVELSINLDWFKDDAPLRVSDSTPPTPLLKTLTALGPNRVALAVLVGGTDWKKGLSVVNGPDGKTTEITDYDAYYDTMILVVDVVQRALVSSTKVTQALTASPGDGLFASMHTSNDVPYVALWRVHDVPLPPLRR